MGTESAKMKLRQKASDLLDRFVGLYVDTPYRCFGGCCLALLVLTGISIGVGSMNMTLDQETAWQVHHGEFSRNLAGFRQAALASSARVAGASNGTVGESKKKPKDLLLLYRAGSGSTAFTPSQLQDICRFETRIVREGSGVCPETGGHPDGHCPLFSPVHTFYGDIFLALNSSCPLLSQSSVDATLRQMVEHIAQWGTSSRYAALVTPGFIGTNETLYTRSSFRIQASTVADTENFLLDNLFSQTEPALAYGFLRSAFQGDDDRMVKLGGVRVRLFYEFDEFMRTLPPDFSLAICSILFVFVTIYLHLGSFFLACFGMWQIVASLPIAALIYRQFFMVEYFEFLHILVVYLVLGVGADDIFVLLDTWRHIKADAKMGWGKAGVDRDTMHRTLRATWSRASSAIFNTSFTTGVAFMSMSISEVMPMKTCGWFAAVAIVLNYIFAITFTPALLMVHQLHFGGKRCCCPDPRSPAADAVREVAVEAEEGTESRKEGGCFSGVIERFLGKVYLPMMQLRLGPLKPVPLFFVAIMSAVAVQGAYFASRLTPPSKPEEWFPNNHMWVGISQFLGSTYYSADFEQYADANFVWGLAEMDFGTFNEYKPDDHPATVRYDASFDLSTRAAQQAFLDTCQQLRTLQCDLPGCKGGQSSYVMQSDRSHAVSCVLEDFQRWLNATQGMSALPQGAAFVPLMERFRNEASPKDYGELPTIVAAKYHELVGIVNGSLQHVAIKVRSNMLKMEPYGTGIKVRTLVQDFAQGLIPSMPASMKSLKVACKEFADFDLGQELVSGLFSGMAIAGPLVFLVLLLSTRNVVLAVYAVISVASIVVSVLGFCKSAMDYDLGVGEAIAGIIVIGYSVDYVVHFAHTYCEASAEGHKTREARAIFTIENMGSTVFAGALTTAGSGVFMFFCLLTFFTKMALLICMTIFFSFLFSLCLFMGLCFLIGPENDFGNICCCLGTGNQVIAPAESAKVSV